MQRAYFATSRLLSALLLAVGVAMFVTAIANGGGALAFGVVLGVAFTALGAARLWLMRAADRGGE